MDDWKRFAPPGKTMITVRPQWRLSFSFYLTGLQPMFVRNYRDLKVWQSGVDLVVRCYRITEHFPSSERYELARQIRRAAVSIPSNIAEGNGRDHLGDYLRHLSFASGSLKELETQLWIANRLEFFDSAALEDVFQRTGELGRMLSGLKRQLRRRQARSSIAIP